MAAKGWLVSPISWSLIGIIWLYNLAWLFIVDGIKVAMFHRLDVIGAGRAWWQRHFTARLDPFADAWANRPEY
jgi:hypothetical protein